LDKPIGRGNRIYQSISSAFSRLSSPIADSLESPTSSGPTADLPEPPTSDHPSPSLSPRRKRQRIYQSLGSAFPNIALDDWPVPEQEDNQQSMEWRFEEPIEEEAKENGGSSDLILNIN